MMGSGIGEGTDRAEDAIQQAIASPLLEDVNVKDAKGLLINITSNGSLTTGEFEAIGEHIGSLVDEDEADVIVGTTVDESLEDRIKVTVVATGMNNSQSTVEKNIENKIDIVLGNSSIKKEDEILITDDEKKEIKFGDFSDIPVCTLQMQESSQVPIEENIPDYRKQQQYVQEENLENKKDNTIKTDSKIEHKKDNNGELDLDYLDIPTFLRTQAD
jgi:cell division GTPase FtsZ